MTYFTEHKLPGWLFFLPVMLSVLFTSCHRPKDHPGYNYYPEMAYSQSYETFRQSSFSRDTLITMEPVAGTVPVHMIPYQFGKNQNDRIRAGLLLTNPFSCDDEVALEGKAIYTMICYQCHGEDLDGKGPLFVNELYPYPPRSLVSESLKAAPDGEIYHTITVGFNLMGPHGSMLLPEERWRVVCYVRSGQ